MASSFANPLVATKLGDGTQSTSFARFQDCVKNWLGEGVSVSKNLPSTLGAPHATTGIPYAIGGTATVIESRISAFLATFKDPLKAILGTGVHKTERIIIKRKYVAGGGAHVVPEHASARTVSIREDVRDITLTRYGTDIEMNLNLFLRPEDAKEELEMKLEAAQISLEKAMIMLGYNQVLDNGIDLTAALARSRSQTSLTDISNIYHRQIFGIMAKSAFPITSLIAAAKHANAYAIGRAAGEEKTVMILPFGTPELTKYTNAHYMEYNLSGVSMPRDKLNLKVPGGMHDPSSNCVIYQHIPPVNMDQGVPHPIVDTSLLANDIYIYARVKSHIGDGGEPSYILNYKTGDMVQLPYMKLDSSVKYDAATGKFSGTPPDISVVRALETDFKNDANNQNLSSAAFNNGKVTEFKKIPTHYIRRTRVRMLSGILAKPGSETGELLYAYSSCSVTTNPGVEIGKLGLRSYLGAAVYNPENIFILPNIAFDDILEDVLFPFHDNGNENGLTAPTIEFVKETDSGVVPTIFDVDAPPLNDNASLKIAMGGATPLSYKPRVIFRSPEVEDNTGNYWTKATADDLSRWKEAFGQNDNITESYNLSLNLCNCAVFNKKSETTTFNNGPMGTLDHPGDIGRISGLFEYGRRTVANGRNAISN